jgi:hypothetical protein
MSQLRAVSLEKPIFVFQFIFVIAFGLFLFADSSRASDSVKITWVPSHNLLLYGYKVYEGTQSGVYTNVVTLAASATNTTFTGLVRGTTYYFNATMFASDGFESPYSGEVVYTDGAAALAPTNSLAGRFSFNVTGLSGQKYVVQSSTDLQNWVACKTNTSPFVFTCTNAATYSRQFFRACLYK